MDALKRILANLASTLPEGTTVELAGARSGEGEAFVRYWFTVLASRIKTSEGIISQISGINKDIDGDLDKIAAHKKQLEKYLYEIDQVSATLKDFPEAMKALQQEEALIDGAWKNLEETERKFRQVKLDIQNAR